MEAALFLYRYLSDMLYQRFHKKHFVDLGFWNSANLTKHKDVLISEIENVCVRYVMFLWDIDDAFLVAVSKMPIRYVPVNSTN